MSEPKDLDAAGALVRRYDHDRYLSALFAPAAERAGLFALYAFNVEIAKTREVVREPVLGSIRLQWWREALEEIYAGAAVRRHEVVEALAAAIRRHGLPSEPFRRLIEAREQDLAPEPPADLGALCAYAEATSSTLVQLALAVVGGGGAPAEAAARDVGVAYGLAGLLRAIPFHARAKRLYLPRAVLEEFQVNQQELFELRPSKSLSAAVRLLAELAERRLVAARAEGSRVPRRALPALLPATIADLYLRRLRRLDYEVFDPTLAQPAPQAAWRMGWLALRGRF